MSDPLRILAEQRITLTDARPRLGTAEKPVAFVTVWRAATLGGMTPSGDRVLLETLKVCGRLMTSVEAIERYVARINGIDLDGSEAAALPVRSKQREKQLASVDAQLTAAGI